MLPGNRKCYQNKKREVFIMKRKYFLVDLFLILAIFLFFSIVGLSKDAKYDFRKTNWGMSKEQVKLAEKSSVLIEEDNMEGTKEGFYDGALKYKGEINGLDCGVYYYFIKNRLTSAEYKKRGSIKLTDEYISDYKNLKAYLVKDFGEPEGIERIKGELGHPFVFHYWNKPTTNTARIYLGLLTLEDKDEIGLSNKYQSNEELTIVEKEELALKQSKQEYDFRQTNWGMSKEQVKATEDKKPDSEDINSLGYNVKIDRDDYLCIYNFLEDKFYNSIYACTEKHTNKNLYIDDYEGLKEILTKKYGEPQTDLIIWKNDLFKNKKQDWGTAISIGHLVYRASWNTSTSTIILVLGGDNYQISLGISYDSKELDEWANKIKEEKAKSKF